MQTIINLEPETIGTWCCLPNSQHRHIKRDKRAAKFAEMTEALGVDLVWTDTAFNVIGLRKAQSSKKRIILEPPMDTMQRVKKTINQNNAPTKSGNCL